MNKTLPKVLKKKVFTAFCDATFTAVNDNFGMKCFVEVPCGGPHENIVGTLKLLKIGLQKFNVEISILASVKNFSYLEKEKS